MYSPYVLVNGKLTLGPAPVVPVVNGFTWESVAQVRTACANLPSQLPKHLTLLAFSRSEQYERELAAFEWARNPARFSKKNRKPDYVHVREMRAQGQWIPYRASTSKGARKG